MEKLKRYFLPSALILAFGLTLAFAQTINKALQLSQDSTGAFGVDTNNNIYLPGHVLTTGPGTPVLTSCGSGSPAITGTDTGGVVTTGTTATGCIITFSKAYLATPYCVVSTQSVLGTTPFQYTASLTALTITQGSATGNLINYVCTGLK